MRLKIVTASFVAILGVALSTLSAVAETAAEYYRGKTLHMVLGVGVGGGNDAYAHMIAPYLSKALGANVVVELQPGAGQLIALNRIYAAPPDGLSVLLINGTPAAISQVIEQDNARFDLTRMEPLGIMNASPSIWLAGPKSGLKTPLDGMQPGRQTLFGGTGPTGGLADPAAMGCEALRMNCKIVLGYKSSADVVLAVERGEIDAVYTSDSSAYHYDRSGRVKAIAVLSRERSQLIPHAPTLFEVMNIPPEDAWIIDYRTQIDGLGRIFLTTPGVPGDRLEALREAFERVLTDPAVIAEATAAERYINFRDWKATKAMLQDALAGLAPERKARIRAAIMGKYN